MPTCNVDLGTLLKRLRQVPRDAQRIIETAIDTDAKGFIKDIVAITPPSMGKANKESQRRGENAIIADLLGLGAGRTKDTRTAGVFVVMSDDLLAKAHFNSSGENIRLFVKKGGIVYGCDRRFYKPHASVDEMFAYHQRLRGKNGRVTKAGGATRDVGRWKFIEQMVVSVSAWNRYKKFILERVGGLAGGFNAAAQKLGVSLPAWIKRHGTGRGAVNIQRSLGRYSITIRNSVPYGNKNDLPRRIRFVLQSDKRKKRLAHRIRAEIRVALRKNKLNA